MKEPAATLPLMLANFHMPIISRNSDAKSPVGAGPFMIKAQERGVPGGCAQAARNGEDVNLAHDGSGLPDGLDVEGQRDALADGQRPVGERGCVPRDAPVGGGISLRSSLAASLPLRGAVTPDRSCSPRSPIPEA